MKEGFQHPNSMRFIDSYLRTHAADMLSKKFVFFVQNEKDLHWWGWAAINPWVQLSRVLHDRILADDPKADSEFAAHLSHVNGLLCCDGMDGNKTLKDAHCFIWFLNMASAYRDMMIENVLDRFDYMVHTPKTYWLLGFRGPFGIIDNSGDESRINYKILMLNEKIRPRQFDGWNCGVIWCLFVFDLMLQASVPYNFAPVQSNELPETLGIGKTWLPPKIKGDLNPESYDTAVSKHGQRMCKIFREELIICLEKLREMRLENFGTVIEKPDGWAVHRPEYKALLNQPLKANVQSIHFKKENKKILAKEDERRLSSQTFDPILPGGLFLSRTMEILGTRS